MTVTPGSTKPGRPLFAFAHIPKTGGTTIARVLKDHLGPRYVTVEMRRGAAFYRQRDLQRDLRLHPWATCLSAHSLKPFVELDPGARPLRWITLLREPRARFLSHYKHQYDRTGGEYRVPLETWSKRFDRANWMVRMIAGEENLEKAIDILQGKFTLVGVLEEVDGFLRALQFFPEFEGIATTAPHENSASRPLEPADAHMPVHDLSDLVDSQNDLDMQLYDLVRQELWMRTREDLQIKLRAAPQTEVAQSRNGLYPARALGTLFRRVVYIPYVRADQAWESIA